jgi:hypothetical protein
VRRTAANARSGGARGGPAGIGRVGVGGGLGGEEEEELTGLEPAGTVLGRQIEKEGWEEKNVTSWRTSQPRDVCTRHFTQVAFIRFC